MKINNFFAELKRRNVYKVAVAYAIVGWLLVQIATQVFPFLEIPNWIVRLVIVLVAIGFPVALIIAWAFELTPEGIKRTEDVDPARASKNRAWIYVAAIGAAFSIGLFFIGRYTGQNTASAAHTEAATALPAKSIAVLPFDNLSRDPDNAFFAEGVQDEILTRLAKVADLKVIARTSTQKFKSAPENLPDIAKQLGALNILEGSVQKAIRRQHSQSDRLLRAGDCARSELCARLRWSRESLHPAPFLRGGGPARCVLESQRRGSQSPPS